MADEHESGSTAMEHKPRWSRLVVAAVVLAAVLYLPQTGIYDQYTNGKMCVLCHELGQPYQDWRTSTHRSVPCTACHSSAFSLSSRMYARAVRDVITHVQGVIPEQVRLKTTDLLEIGPRCQSCHRQEYVAWAAGPHGTTYSRIFLDGNHNR